jgi:hypothetical protein
MSRVPRMIVAAIMAVFVFTLSAEPTEAQTGVAHWSFDTPTLTIDNGNIIGVADKTTNHNATPGTGGTGGAAGNNFISQPFPLATSSVTGQFGNAMRFGGNNFLLFNNLTELMAANGGPSYSVSMWEKTESAGGGVGSPYATLANWGNQPAATGPTRFTYGFGSNAASQMRGQTRRANPASGGGGTDGSDIYSRIVNTPTPINNGSWHMLTWTFDTTTGVIKSYYDAALLETFTSTSPSFIMGDSSSLVGGMGIKADSGTFLPAGVMLDEVYVFTGSVLTQEHVTNLFTSNAPPPGSFPDPINLTLRVNPATGQAQLRNDSAANVALSGYRITSPANALNPSGWDPIATGTPIAGFPQGNGTGNGWEIPPGGGSVAGDHNNNGKVDGADYVVWRKTNINGAAGYTTWRSNFGATGSGGNGGDPNELVEWYLTGESTLNSAASISLGQAFTIGGAQNLVFQFTTSAGVKTGIVEYGAIGAGTGASAIPEPSAGWLVLIAFGLAVGIWRRRIAPAPVTARIAACLLVTSVSVGSALATVTNDRLHHFGENGVNPQAQENGAAGNLVGSGHTLTPGFSTTLDDTGPSGSFQTLQAFSCTTCAGSNGVIPAYQALASGRTGLGIVFDGTDDYLNGFSLGFPPLSRGTINGGGSGTLNYNGVYQRGYQLWVYPHAGATAEQHIVSDTTEHGVRISTAGNWILRHSGTNVTTTVPATVNQWAHVMVTMPDNSQPHKGVLYVNGVALAVQAENYDTTAVVNAQALIVGANTDANGTLVGTTNFFRGVLDELEMFIWGRGYNHLTDTYTNFGTFNFATDNDYAASQLTGIPGDINSSGGAVNQADIDAFVAGWLFEKRVNNIRVGDLFTFAKGDLNFDGITNVTDMALFRNAIGGAGSGAGFDLTAFNSLGVPEPSSFALTVVLIGLWSPCRRHPRTGS